MPHRLWSEGGRDMVIKLFLLHWVHRVQIERPLSPSSASIAESMLEGLVCIFRAERSRCCSELEMFQRTQCGLGSWRSRLSWWWISVVTHMRPLCVLIVTWIAFDLHSSSMSCGARWRYLDCTRNRAVSGCEDWRPVISEVATLFPIALWIILDPGLKRVARFCLVIASIRSCVMV